MTGAGTEGPTTWEAGTGAGALKVPQHGGALTVGAPLDWQQGMALRVAQGPHAAYSTPGSPANRVRTRRRAALRVRRSSFMVTLYGAVCRPRAVSGNGRLRVSGWLVPHPEGWPAR